MSLTGELAIPQEVVIKDNFQTAKNLPEGTPRYTLRTGLLHPLTIAAYGLAARDYEASLRYVAIKSTIGLPPAERKKAIEDAAVEFAKINDDITILALWIHNSHDGLLAGLKPCLAMRDGMPVSDEIISRWISETGIGQGTKIDQWFVDSHIRTYAPEAEEAEAEPEKKTEGSDLTSPPQTSSEEASSTGVTE